MSCLMAGLSFSSHHTTERVFGWYNGLKVLGAKGKQKKQGIAKQLQGVMLISVCRVM